MWEDRLQEEDGCLLLGRACRFSDCYPFLSGGVGGISISTIPPGRALRGRHQVI